MTNVIGFNSESRFLDQAFEDGVALLIEAKNYMTYQEKREREGCNLSTGLRIGYQQTRITARLMHSLSWLLSHKAVAAGEVDQADLVDANWTVGGGAECFEATGHNDENLPKGLRTLLERSHAFYMRTARLEAMMKTAEPKVSTAAPKPAQPFAGLYIISSDVQEEIAQRA